MKVKLKIDLPIEADSFDNSLDWLGSQLFAVKGGDGKICVVDAATGKILWELENCFVGVNGLCIGDNDAVYVAREQGAKRFITAHKRDTGEEIWNCYLSTSSSQFCSPLTQNEKYIFHTNTSQIYVVDKFSGKVANKFKVAYKDVEDGIRVVLPWDDKVLYPGWIESGKGKTKQTSLVLSLYDPLNKDNAFIEDIITIKGRYGVLHSELAGENLLFFLVEDAIVRIIDLGTKQTVFEHDFVPNGDQTMHGYREGYMSQINANGDKLHFVVMATDTERNEDDDFVSHKNFSTLNISKKTLENKEIASVGSFDHYYYDGNLVYTGYNTFKPEDPKHKTEIKLDSEGEILLMNVIDGKFYLLQENEDETSFLVLE